MTKAQWEASIPAQGILIVDECATFVAQALSDGDAQLATDLLGGSAATNAQLNSRAELVALFSLYGRASQDTPGTVLTTQSRNALLNAGTNFYNVTGAP